MSRCPLLCGGRKRRLPSDPLWMVEWQMAQLSAMLQSQRLSLNHSFLHQGIRGYKDFRSQAPCFRLMRGWPEQVQQAVLEGLAFQVSPDDNNTRFGDMLRYH